MKIESIPSAGQETATHHTIDALRQRHQEINVEGVSIGGLVNISKGRILGQPVWLIILVGVYVTLLHYVYAQKIAPAFHYLNLHYRSPDPANYIISLALVILLALTMPHRLRRPSDLILWLLFVMMTIPIIVVPQFAKILSVDKALELALVVSGIFLMVVLAVRYGPQQKISFKLSLPNVWLVLAIVSAVTYGYMALTTGLTFRLVSLDAVRELRFAYREEIAAGGPLLGYLVRLQGNVINPIIMARGIHSGRWVSVALACVGQVLIFSATGFKLTLLSIPAILILTLLFHRGPRPKGRSILIGIMATMAIALIADQLMGGLLYTEIFVNRLLLTPGILAAAHVMVFSTLTKAEWGYTFMAPFVDYPYQQTPDFIVGSVFLGSPETSANANLFADGFSNFGYPGMFIEAVVLIGLLWMIDSCARHLPLAVTSLILLIPTVALVNSSIFTSFLTNGFAYAAVVMACLPSTGWTRDRTATGLPKLRQALSIRFWNSNSRPADAERHCT